MQRADKECSSDMYTCRTILISDYVNVLMCNILISCITTTNVSCIYIRIAHWNIDAKSAHSCNKRRGKVKAGGRKFQIPVDLTVNTRTFRHKLQYERYMHIYFLFHIQLYVSDSYTKKASIRIFFFLFQLRELLSPGKLHYHAKLAAHLQAFILD